MESFRIQTMSTAFSINHVECTSTPHSSCTSVCVRKKGGKTLIFPLHAKAFLPQHVWNLRITVLCQVDSFLFTPVFVHDDQIWIMALNPFDLQILPLFPALLLSQPPPNFSKVV
eukprot:TRINITY_DN56483_c0_g1_i1.p1 TRINITY_DN56483_c0_g1~~TRINITY_DN56483_c0_g1_i1.p1  ORF type:complete len:114 (+),score=5.18 TRINITY_DN56483_c0_g1_i1:1-342(+)